MELPDGRRVSASYDRSRDWWVATLVGSEGDVAAGRALYRVVRDLLGIPPTTPNDQKLTDAIDRLALVDTPSGQRAQCRCCGFLTLSRPAYYEICPVCRWEDDPTTIFEPGETKGGPGPNHLSLSEGRRNFQEHGISTPRLANRVTVRPPLPDEHPESP